MLPTRRLPAPIKRPYGGDPIGQSQGPPLAAEPDWSIQALRRASNHTVGLLAHRRGVPPITWETQLNPQNTQRLREIEAELAGMGLGIEGSLASIDGDGDALFELASGELVEPPNDQALQLAIEWTELTAP